MAWVMGPRSAIFTPLPDLGLVLVDEEHEGAYKQEDAPRYHARDVAIERARQVGGVVVLGTSYLTQLVLYNEARSEPSPRFLQKHQPWLTLSLLLVVSSIVAFALGSFCAVASYEALFSN